MKYLATAKTSTPEKRTAERLANLDECLYCETVTGEVDVIAKFSMMPKDSEGVRFYGVIDELMYLKPEESSLPFWWLVDSRIRGGPAKKALKSALGSISSVTEGYEVESPFNFWLRGGVKNSLALSKLQDKLYNPLLCSDSRTYVVYRRFYKT